MKPNQTKADENKNPNERRKKKNTKQNKKHQTQQKKKSDKKTNKQTVRSEQEWALCAFYTFSMHRLSSDLSNSFSVLEPKSS